MSLPNPGMSFSPFAILTAEEMNDIVENIEALADGTGFDAGAVGPESRSGGFWSIFHDFGAGTGSKSITDVPFKPKQILIMGNGRNSGSEASNSSGYATDGSPIVQGAQSSFGVNALSHTSTTSSDTSAILARTNGGIVFEAAVTSFNSDGITVNVTTNTGASSGVYARFHIVFLA